MKTPRYMNRVDCYECKHHEQNKLYEGTTNFYSDYCNLKEIRLAGTFSFPRECDQFLNKKQLILFEGEE